jgi:hypothetical protein
MHFIATAFSFALPSAGSSMDARMAMMAITTNSSINVNRRDRIKRVPGRHGFRVLGMTRGLAGNYGGGGFDCNWCMGMVLFRPGAAGTTIAQRRAIAHRSPEHGMEERQGIQRWRQGGSNVTVVPWLISM